MSQSVPGIPRDPLIGPVPGSLHRRRALVRMVSRGASPVTARCPIQIRSHPPAETKESGHLVNQFKSNTLLANDYLSTNLPITKLYLWSFLSTPTPSLFPPLRFVGYGCIVYYKGFDTLSDMLKRSNAL